VNVGFLNVENANPLRFCLVLWKESGKKKFTEINEWTWTKVSSNSFINFCNFIFSIFLFIIPNTPLDYCHDVLRFGKISQLKSRPWNVVIEHTFLKGNRCANHLAKLGAASNSPLLLLTDPPFKLIRLLQGDVGGVYVVTCKGVISFFFLI
jgi:hypothetical protein